MERHGARWRPRFSSRTVRARLPRQPLRIASAVPPTEASSDQHQRGWLTLETSRSDDPGERARVWLSAAASARFAYITRCVNKCSCPTFVDGARLSGEITRGDEHAAIRPASRVIRNETLRCQRTATRMSSMPLDSAATCPAAEIALRISQWRVASRRLPRDFVIILRECERPEAFLPATVE